jgi:hypothetical protein
MNTHQLGILKLLGIVPGACFSSRQVPSKRPTPNDLGNPGMVKAGPNYLIQAAEPERLQLVRCRLICHPDQMSVPITS